jgi:hypothetical protein
VANGGAVTVAGAVVTIPLTNVTSAQTIAITLFGVDNGSGAANATIRMGILVGDSTGDGSVNSGDVTQTRNRSGQQTDAINFRSDFNLDGTINAGDATVVKARSGQFIP